MPGPLKAYPLWGMTAGLIVNAPSPSIPQGATDQCSNVFFPLNGTIAPRPGLGAVLAGALPNVAQAAYMFARFLTINGAEKIVSGALNSTTGAVTLANYNGATWNNLTGALSPTGSLDIPATFAQFKGNFYMTPGTSDLLQWDGVAGSFITVKSLQATPSLQPPTSPRVVMSAPSGSHIIMMNFFDPVSGGAEPQGLAWSGFLDQTTWNGGNFGNGSGTILLADDNEPLVGGGFIGPLAIAGKQRTIYTGQFVGPPAFWTFLRNPVGDDRGIVSHSTFGRFAAMVFWLGDENVYSFDGNTITPLADPILVRFLKAINPNYMNRAFAMVDRFEQYYHLFLPVAGSSQVIKVFHLNIKTGAWTESQIDPSVFPVSGYQKRSLKPWTEALVVGTAAGQFLQFLSAHDGGYTTDNGAGFVPTWRSRILDAVILNNPYASIAGGQGEETSVQEIAVHGFGGNVTVTVTYGDALHEMTHSDSQKLTLVQGAEIKAQFRINARFVQITLTWDMTSVCEIDGLTLYLGAKAGVARK